MTTVGSGDFSYEALDSWGALPSGFVWGQIGSVSVDSNDRVYVFTRTEHPIMLFERDGRYVGTMGEGIIKDAHGISIGPDGSIFLVDRSEQVVMKWDKDGKKLFELGNRGVASDTGYADDDRTVKRRAGPFNYPTNVAFSTGGDFYVSDGYRNAAVHKFDAEGKHLFSWGEPGVVSGRDKPGSFNLVHAVWEHKGKVYIADRENGRVQIFTPQGEYVDMWTGFSQPTDFYIDDNDVVYMSELGGRVTLLTLDGEIILQIGSPDDKVAEAGKFIAPHGIWVDSHGDFYVSEVLQGQRIQKFIRQR